MKKKFVKPNVQTKIHMPLHYFSIFGPLFDAGLKTFFFEGSFYTQSQINTHKLFIVSDA